MDKNIFIPNPSNLEKIKKAIVKAGPEKLHILADFDSTLTRAYVDGKEVPSMLFLLYNGNYLSPDYNQKAKALQAKYRPIEDSPRICEKEKKKAMEEWWTLHFKLLIESGLNKKEIESVVDSGKTKFRSGFPEFCDLLKSKDVPLVIMSSSGLGGDAVSMLLKKEGRLNGNIFIISNSFKWDKNGNAVDIKKPIIHGMNKDDTMIQKFPAFEAVKDRKNVILLGNSVGDVGMVKGFDCENLVKIGFLNYNVKESLDFFSRAYDVLILGDGPMGYINNLIKDILGRD